MIIRSFEDVLPHCNIKRLASLIRGRSFNEFYPYKTNITESTLEIHMFHNVNPRESARIIVIGRVVRYYINEVMIHEFQIGDDPRPAEFKDDREWGTEKDILKVIVSQTSVCADVVRIFGTVGMNTLSDLEKRVVPEWKESLSKSFIEYIVPSLRILSYKEARTLIDGLSLFFDLVPKGKYGGYVFDSPIEAGSTVAFTMARPDGRCFRFIYDPVNLSNVQVYYNGRVVKSVCLNNKLGYKDLAYFLEVQHAAADDIEKYETKMLEHEANMLKV